MTVPKAPGAPSFLNQPRSVWAVAFACVISFMGIGLVDPILPTMASQLHATPAQMSLLFTSFLLVTAVAMLMTGWVSSRIGAKRTLVVGLVIIVVFSALAGTAGGVNGIIGFRAGWGLGNALFIATSLAVIVGAASGGFAGAIVLYEAALGVGIAMGPMVGAALGGISWRGPFFGVAALMGVALICVITLVAPTPLPAERARISDPVKALRNRGLLTIAVTALLYNSGFFIVMGYSPYPMKIGVHELGLVFFGWGLLVAVFAVFCAPWAQRRIGTAASLYLTLFFMSLDVAAIGLWIDRPPVVIACVIVSGAFIGMNNTLVTGTVMQVSPVPRPTASAAYSFVRFIGAGLAPWLGGIVAAHYGEAALFYLAGGAVFLGLLVLATAHSLVVRAHVPTEHESDEAAEELVESAEGNVLHGHLRGVDGAPLAGAALTLIDSAGRQVARGRSSADGYYHLVGPSVGSHTLVLAATGDEPQSFPVELGRAPTELGFQLDRAAAT
jgi:MFS transporter, ACDE family, multidrug resistance protein